MALMFSSEVLTLREKNLLMVLMEASYSSSKVCDRCFWMDRQVRGGSAPSDLLFATEIEEKLFSISLNYRYSNAIYLLILI